MDQSLDPKPPKAPVVRGARACTTCRAAKMKCVGAEDGEKPCQRCQRSGVECVFEKHRRGRKPGSKLSEASKMLRRLEKGLSSAKAQSQANEISLQNSAYPASADTRSASGSSYRHPAHYPPNQENSPNTLFASNELPPLHLIGGRGPGSSAHTMDVDDDSSGDDEDGCHQEENMYPAKLIGKENQRNSFFRTILNPSDEVPLHSSSMSSESRNGASVGSYGSSNGPATSPGPQPPLRPAPIPEGLDDPITAGLLENEAEAVVLLDLVFLRLNPFINLFDPALHTVAYVRARSPFLFTTLIMAGCKFWKPDCFRACQRLAHEFAVRAFAEAWKSVEVVQAFACLTYWKEPDDTRTWMYIGYACRMAVELGLNRYVPNPPANETDFAMRVRRNNERTYLVLFVHDRSLSTQTGRQWMLPEDDLVRFSGTWHEQGEVSIRPEDVIVAGMVQLRRVAAETIDVFYSHRGQPGSTHNDVNYDVLLRGCNTKLTQWMDTWQVEMQKANGAPFHNSFLVFWRLYIRLFLNSFGLQSSMSSSSHASPSLQALQACYTSAMDMLRIVTNDFAHVSMLRYSQESVATMTAYAAVFLLKLLRSTNTVAELQAGAADDIYEIINKTADVYQDAAVLASSSSAAAYHARFLRSLVQNHIARTRQMERDDATTKFDQQQQQQQQQAQGQQLMQNGNVLERYPGGGGYVTSSSSSSQAQNNSSPRFLPPPQPPHLMTSPTSPTTYTHPPTSSSGITNSLQHSHSHSHSSHTRHHQVQQRQEHSFHFPASPHLPAHPMISAERDIQADTFSPSGPNPNNNSRSAGYPPNSANVNGNGNTFSPPVPTAELDANYWRNMFRDLGFGDGPGVIGEAVGAGMVAYESVPLASAQAAGPPPPHPHHTHGYHHHPMSS